MSMYWVPITMDVLVEADDAEDAADKACDEGQWEDTALVGVNGEPRCDEDEDEEGSEG